MKLVILTMTAVLTLSACGGRVSGDVGKACVNADRKAANAELCSCVQRAANQTLSGSEQAKAVAFFENPQLAQDTRQQGSTSSSRFWKRYKAFSAKARQMCG